MYAPAAHPPHTPRPQRHAAQVSCTGAERPLISIIDPTHRCRAKLWINHSMAYAAMTGVVTTSIGSGGSNAWR